jgi:hypothetical protein
VLPRLPAGKAQAQAQAHGTFGRRVPVVDCYECSGTQHAVSCRAYSTRGSCWRTHGYCGRCRRRRQR